LDAASLERFSPVATVEAWIPDTLRFASLADEVGNDGLSGLPLPVSNADDWLRRQTAAVIPDLASD
jgi:hypothetical protein